MEDAGENNEPWEVPAEERGWCPERKGEIDPINERHLGSRRFSVPGFEGGGGHVPRP